MDRLFSPWRYTYISSAGDSSGCLFCEKLKEKDDHKSWIVHRARENFIILNAFPYTSGHVMIAPYAHLERLDRLPSSTANEMMSLAQKLESVLRDLYRPDGLNLGVNIGKAAGAGVAGHIHMHLLPRWIGDSNFMGAVGETRLLPEDLETTYARLTQHLMRGFAGQGLLGTEP